MNSWQKFFHRQIVKTLLPRKNVTPNIPIKPKQKKLEIVQKIPTRPENIFVHRVNCTLSKKEYKQLKNISEAQKISHTKLLKKLAFSLLEKRKYFSPSGEKNLRGLILEIRKIGVNINQIAKHTNTFQKVGFPDLREVHKRLDELEKMLHEAIIFFGK